VNDGLLALDLEVMEHGGGGLLDDLVVELLDGFADDLDAHILDGAGDVLAVGGLKYQAMGM
jgi:hypothetical protein